MKTPEQYAHPAFRVHALALQRAGLSIRAIAAETGRSKSSLVRDLLWAREEERAAKAAKRAGVGREPDQGAERRPGASVLILDHHGDLRRPDGTRVASAQFKLPRPLHRKGLAAVMEENQRIVRAGLSATGMAQYETPIGRGSYDPADRGDVERVRGVIRDDVRRYCVAEGNSPEVAEMHADEAADNWQPHPGLR